MILSGFTWGNSGSTAQISVCFTLHRTGSNLQCVYVCVWQFQKPSGLHKAELEALRCPPARCEAWQWCWVQHGITALRALLCPLPALGNAWGAAELHWHQECHLGISACHNVNVSELAISGFKDQERHDVFLFFTENKNSFSNKAKLTEFWLKCFPKPILPSTAINRGNSCMLLLFAQCWLGHPSNSFQHSTLSSTEDKPQQQLTNQGGRSGGDQQQTAGLHYYTNTVMQLNIGRCMAIAPQVWIPPAGLHTVAPAARSLAGAVRAGCCVCSAHALWHLLGGDLTTSREPASISPRENRRFASDCTARGIRLPCRTSAYQLVTLTDPICGEPLWKMQSIMQPLLIFCFCYIYLWFMALQGG